MEFDGFPYMVGWELTLTCDLRCGHCGSTAGNPRDGELSTGEALSICDQFPELLVQEVDFTGGEPLVRKDWPIIAERLSSLDIATRMVTNGLRLTPETVARMQQVGITGLGVSVDGLRSTHDYMRRREGLYDQVCSGIRAALDGGLSVTVITTISGLNVHQLPEMFSELFSIGVRRWRLQPIFPLGRLRQFDELRLSEESFKASGHIVAELQQRGREKGMEIRTGDAFGYYTEGSLREHSLWDLWFAPDAFAYNRKFQSDDLGDACKGRDMANQCKGGCCAMSIGAKGRLHNDPFCFHGIAARERTTGLGVAVNASMPTP